MSITKSTTNDFKFNTLHEVCKRELYEKLMARGKAPELSIKSLPDLNRKIWGLKRGQMTVIGARTSHGKSAMALQFAYDLALQKKTVMFFSLEMSKSDMAERLYCYENSIDNYALQTGQFKEQYKDNWDSHLKSIENLPLIFSDCMGKSWKEIDKTMENLPNKPDVVILDYIQAIKGGLLSERVGIDDYIINFRSMAIKYNFAGILCSQLNRDAKKEGDGTPQLHQLKGSGFIEEHCDVAILLYWETKHEEAERYKYQIEVAKNRNGRTGFMNLWYYPQYYRFENMEKEPENEVEAKKQELSEQWA